MFMGAHDVYEYRNQYVPFRAQRTALDGIAGQDDGAAAEGPRRLFLIAASLVEAIRADPSIFGGPHSSHEDFERICRCGSRI